jgi:chemotaxis protein methyltransferase CheR
VLNGKLSLSTFPLQREHIEKPTAPMITKTDSLPGISATDESPNNASQAVMRTEDIEIQLLLEAIYLQYGYDFRSYAKASVKRRILHRLAMSGMSDISSLQHRILVEKPFFESLLLDLSINVTEMFRDPTFYKALRSEVVPTLRTYPFIRIWVAGCASGEEVYSLAILLMEEGFGNRFQIYATDFNEVVLRKAKEGIYPIGKIREYTSNYQKAGGLETFSDYYTAHYDSVIMSQALKERVVFSSHNLATDSVFNEMQLISCRNVLIYFDRNLQNRVLNLFQDSLCRGGFLCLGKKETLQFSDCDPNFEGVVNSEKIYQKKTG